MHPCNRLEGNSASTEGAVLWCLQKYSRLATKVEMKWYSNSSRLFCQQQQLLFVPKRLTHAVFLSKHHAASNSVGLVTNCMEFARALSSPSSLLCSWVQRPFLRLNHCLLFCHFQTLFGLQFTNWKSKAVFSAHFWLPMNGFSIWPSF